jgi:phage terminase large subunit GpA-like protein
LTLKNGRNRALSPVRLQHGRHALDLAARAGKNKRHGGSNVWTIGVDTVKDAIYSKLKVTTPGPGYCHFPIAYQQ